MSKLNVILTYQNPCGFKTRERLFREMCERLDKTSGIRVHTIEVVHPPHYALAVGGNHTRVFSETKLYYQYSMINIVWKQIYQREHLFSDGMAGVPADPFAWLDADIAFTRPDWPEATCRALEKYGVVQMFSQAVDLGPSYELSGPLTGYQRALSLQGRGGGITGIHPTGFAWAARSSALPFGLCDAGIMNGGDFFTALSLRGKSLSRVIYPDDYVDRWMAWARNLPEEAYNVGYVDGTVLHYWHGSRANRQGRPSLWRPEAFKQLEFSIDRDTFRAANGLIDLCDTPAGRVMRKAGEQMLQYQKDDDLTMAVDESAIPSASPIE